MIWSSWCYGFLGKLLSWYLVYSTDPPSMADLECESWIHVNHNHIKQGDKLKHNNVLELYFISLRNVCNPRLLDVPSTCKHACFTCELEASSFGSMISNLWVLHLSSLSKCWCRVEMPMRFAPRAWANYEKKIHVLANLRFGSRPS